MARIGSETVSRELADMPEAVVDFDPRPRLVLFLVATRVLRDPDRLHRRRRIDDHLRAINLRGQVHRGNEHRPALGVREGLTHQRESLGELVDHVS